MTISIIIPVYNEENFIDNCLSHLAPQVKKPDEIIIVDNNCVDKTINIVKKYPAIIVNEKKQGMIPARNKGFNTARGDILARIDADTIVGPDWIKRIKNDFEHNKIIGLTGPMFPYDLPLKQVISKTHAFMYFELLKLIHNHYLLFGSNMAITRQVWHKVKNHICLDDKLAHEDVDLSVNVVKHGHIMYDDKLKVSISSRRIRKPLSMTEYLLRYFKQLRMYQLKKQKK